jgi:peroxiredoxin Q/BCP
MGRIESAGAVVLGISLDDVDSHQKFRDKFELPFPLLADTDHTVADAYGVYGEKTFREHKYMGIDRATFLIGPDGTLEKVWAQVNPAGHADEVLEAMAGHAH